MTKPLEFWFEFASTYSYPAAARVQAVTEAAGVPLVWRPFLLGPIFRELGWNDSPFNLQPAKGRYMWRDLERICAAASLPFRRPSAFPRNSLLAARVTTAALEAKAPWLPEFVRVVYAANFAHDREISHPDVLRELLEAVGAESSQWLAAAGSEAVKQALRTRTEEAREAGVFGAPSFRVGGELFWGNDRLGDAVAWARLGGGSLEKR